MGFLALYDELYDERNRSSTKPCQSHKITVAGSGSVERALTPLASVTAYMSFINTETVRLQMSASGKNRRPESQIKKK